MPERAAAGPVATRPPDPAAPPGPPPLARAGVGAVAAVAGVVLLLASGRYGFFGDELYFRASGDRPMWSYADNGPVVPLLARLMGTLVPDSLTALRLPSVLLTVAAILATALMAREFGGGRAAQVLAAATYATSPLLLAQGAMLSTNAVDTALWTVTTWLVVRWARTRRDRWLLAAGVVTAVAVQVKWLIPVFWAVLVAAALLVGPRELPRRPGLWAGGAVTVALAVPGLLWQAGHGWPYLGMGAVVRGEQALVAGRLTFVPFLLFSLGLLGSLLTVYGGWRLLRAPGYRFLGLTAVGVVAVFVAADGRPYYPAGVAGMCVAAGAAAATRRLTGRRLALAAVPLLVVSAALTAPGLPWRSPEDVRPPADEMQRATRLSLYGQFGWPEAAATTGAAYRSLPPELAARTVVLTDSYWTASALDRLGTGLPPVFSTDRGYWYLGTPPASATSVLYVGSRPPDGFAEVRRLATVTAPLGIPDGAGVWLASGPARPWPEYWARHNRLVPR
jgi:4-amino-4-deoxy-L-arabinose transferase-like glycosyltransferase